MNAAEMIKRLQQVPGDYEVTVEIDGYFYPVEETGASCSNTRFEMSRFGGGLSEQIYGTFDISVNNSQGNQLVFSENEH
jgi:hypothetical protein